MEKEPLAAAFADKRFHQYVFGRSVIAQTDWLEAPEQSMSMTY